VGRWLLAAAERHAAELALGELRLHANAAMSENLSFYPRLGYAEVGRGVEDGFDRVYFAKPAPPNAVDREAPLLERSPRVSEPETFDPR
jgi:hypothetical protein